jgi:hypothetical protein
VGITGKAGVGLGFLTSWMLGLGCDL